MRSPSSSGAVLVEPIEADSGGTPVQRPCPSLPIRSDRRRRRPDRPVAGAVCRARGVRAKADPLCLLVVGPADPAPRQWGELEDWVREPVRDHELVIRAVTVARRADADCQPSLDHLGRLSFRGRTVILPMSQRAIVARLLEVPGEVVSDGEICALFGQGLASTHAEAVKTALRRIKDALAPVGLRLTRVRAAGYLLDRASRYERGSSSLGIKNKC